MIRKWGPHYNESMFEDSVHVTFPDEIADTQSKVAFYGKYYSKRLAMKVMALYSEVCTIGKLVNLRTLIPNSDFE